LRDQRQHQLGPFAHRLSQRGQHERAVVKIGAQGHDRAQAAARLGYRVQQAVEKLGALLLIRHEREDLLELVDDQHQFRVVVGQDAQDEIVQPAIAGAQRLARGQRFVGGDAQQGRLQLVEWGGAGDHPRDEPARRSRQIAATQRGDEPGLHHARFAAAARPHHGQEAGHGARLGHTPDQALHQRLAPKKVRCVGFIEGAQTFVRVFRLQCLVQDQRVLLELERMKALACIAFAALACRKCRQAAMGSGLQRPPEIGSHAQRIPIADLGVFGGSLQDDGVHLVGQIGRIHLQRRHRIVQVLGHQRGVSRRVEWQLAGEQLVKNDAQAVNVGLRRRGLVADALRRDIGWGSVKLFVGTAVVAHGIFGDAEVGQISVVLLIEQDIGRGQVAVDDPAPVGDRQRGRDLVEQAGDGGQRPGAMPLDRVMEIAAAQPAHDQIRVVGLAPEVVERHDMHVLQPGDQLRFGFEPADKFGAVGVARQDDLDGDFALDSRLEGAINSREPADSDQFAQQISLDLVAAEIAHHLLFSATTLSPDGLFAQQNAPGH